MSDLNRKYNMCNVDIGGFIGDTEIWNSLGAYETIKSLSEKNTPFLIESFDFDINGFIYSKAVAFKAREKADLVEVIYSSLFSKENKIRCTHNQKFLVSTNSKVYYDEPKTNLILVEAKDLKAGMRLVAEDSNLFIKEVTLLEKKMMFIP